MMVDVAQLALMNLSQKTILISLFSPMLGPAAALTAVPETGTLQRSLLDIAVNFKLRKPVLRNGRGAIISAYSAEEKSNIRGELR